MYESVISIAVAAYLLSVTELVVRPLGLFLIGK